MDNKNMKPWRLTAVMLRQAGLTSLVTVALTGIGVLFVPSQPHSLSIDYFFQTMTILSEIAAVLLFVSGAIFGTLKIVTARREKERHTTQEN